jgi:hypothetical protein
MTTIISIKDAVILAHLSKQPDEDQRLLLTSRLSEEAKPLAELMRNDPNKERAI